MPLSTEEYFARLHLLYEQLERLSTTAGQLPMIDAQQLARVLEYAFQTVPEFDQCWNGIRVWVETMTTFLEQYYALASQLFEEEDTLILPALPTGRVKGEYEAADGVPASRV